jgi:hypothetical protein
MLLSEIIDNKIQFLKTGGASDLLDSACRTIMRAGNHAYRN